MSILNSRNIDFKLREAIGYKLIDICLIKPLKRTISLEEGSLFGLIKLLPLGYD